MTLKISSFQKSNFHPKRIWASTFAFLNPQQSLYYIRLQKLRVLAQIKGSK